MTAPDPTPPCLGEREAVARTELREALARHFDGSAFQSAHQEGQYWSIRRVDAYRRADALLAVPLRTENETLRAERDAARKALEPFAKAAEDWDPEQNAGDTFHDQECIASGETSVKVGDLRAARAALTTPEHPHGD